jgi:GNAT superfamily N-acetyltransferase
MAVHPQYQRQGIAGALVREIEHWLQGMGAKRINAQVEKEHPWAIAYWEAVGYSPEHHMLRYSKSLEVASS